MRISRIFFTSSVLLSAIWPTCALASAIVSLNNPGSTALHEVWAEPGEVFSADLNLNTDCGVGLIALSLHASSSYVFNVAGVTENAPWSSNGTATTMAGDLDPTSSSSVFKLYGDPFGPGITTVASIQMIVEPGASLGQYTMDTAEIWWSETRFVEGQPGQAGPSLVVHVVPECSTCLLALVIARLCIRRSH